MNSINPFIVMLSKNESILTLPWARWSPWARWNASPSPTSPASPEWTPSSPRSCPSSLWRWRPTPGWPSSSSWPSLPSFTQKEYIKRRFPLSLLSTIENKITSLDRSKKVSLAFFLCRFEPAFVFTMASFCCLFSTRFYGWKCCCFSSLDLPCIIAFWSRKQLQIACRHGRQTVWEENHWGKEGGGRGNLGWWRLESVGKGENRAEFNRRFDCLWKGWKGIRSQDLLSCLPFFLLPSGGRAFPSQSRKRRKQLRKSFR